ncbi:MAG: hypothetical protein AAF960_21360 [Bacteroidota bacterium]
MNNRGYQLFKSVGWLFLTIAFISLSLEFFLFEFADYDIYRVLNISFRDFLLLSSILIVQYLLLKQVTRHVKIIVEVTKNFSQRTITVLAIALVAGGPYALLPSQFPFWIFFLLLGCLSVFYVFTSYFVHTPIHKVAYLLLLGAGMNSSLLFWMHEEANEGRQVRYAQQLAERRDTVAEQLLKELAPLGKSLTDDTNKTHFWEKKWLETPYLSSNYTVRVEENSSDSTKAYFEPFWEKTNTSVPSYVLYFPDSYALRFTLHTDFERSIYSLGVPYKQLQDLADFDFAVVDKSQIILSNTHAFSSNIFDLDLPEVGQSAKIEVKGFDISAYHHTDDLFVLIGGPLSEIQVWMSNFAFFFTLLLGNCTDFRSIDSFFSKKERLSLLARIGYPTADSNHSYRHHLPIIFHHCYDDLFVFKPK